MSHEFFIALSKIGRCRLEALVSDDKAPRKHLRRAEVVLLLAEGATVREITRRTGRSRTFILRWRERFIEQGFEGLLHNKRRSGGIVPIRAEAAHRGKALMLIGSPSCSGSPRHAVFSELMRIDGQLAELSERLHLLEDRSVQRLSCFGSINRSSIPMPIIFREDEENSFAAHVAFGMSKSRMNS
jgi:Winged helix-turn helix